MSSGCKSRTEMHLDDLDAFDVTERPVIGWSGIGATVERKRGYGKRIRRKTAHNNAWFLLLLVFFGTFPSEILPQSQRMDYIAYYIFSHSRLFILVSWVTSWVVNKHTSTTKIKRKCTILPSAITDLQTGSLGHRKVNRGKMMWVKYKL